MIGLKCLKSSSVPSAVRGFEGKMQTWASRSQASMVPGSGRAGNDDLNDISMIQIWGERFPVSQSGP